MVFVRSIKIRYYYYYTDVIFRIFSTFHRILRIFQNFSNPFFSYSRNVRCLKAVYVYGFFAVSVCSGCDRSNKYDCRRRSSGCFSSFFLFSHIASRFADADRCTRYLFYFFAWLIRSSFIDKQYCFFDSINCVLLYLYCFVVFGRFNGLFIGKSQYSYKYYNIW